MNVKKRNGRLEDFNVDKINACAQRACENIEDVSASEVVLDAQLQLFDKITTRELDQALIFSAREKIEKEQRRCEKTCLLLMGWWPGNSGSGSHMITVLTNGAGFRSAIA